MRDKIDTVALTIGGKRVEESKRFDVANPGTPHVSNHQPATNDRPIDQQCLISVPFAIFS